MPVPPPSSACGLQAQGSILVAIATYNEIDNLPSLVEAIHRELPHADVLVIDDNSPDGTGDWCREFATTVEWFSCIHRDGKQGLGSALIAAIDWANERGYQKLVTLDADWSHPPTSLPALVAAATDADIVIGSRYCQGGTIAGWSWRRRWASRANNWLSRHLLRLPIHDGSGNYRLYDLQRLGQIDRAELRSSGYAFLEEVLWLLNRERTRFAEVPIAFTDRTAGASKIGVREVFGKVGTLSRLAFRQLLSIGRQSR